MTTKGQQLKKELTQTFSGLKFFVKTKMVCKGHITEITVTVKGLQNSDYTVAEVKEITNKYHNWDWRTVTGDTNVVVNADEETKEESNNLVIETKEETKEETVNNTVIETIKEVALQNKVAKLQAKLTRLNAQLSITKGNRNKARLVLEILKVESAIEQLELEQKEITLTWEQKKSLNALTGGKFIFSKLTEKSKKELLKIVNELEALNREADRDNCTGKGAWKKPSEASIKRSEKRSNKYRLLKERIEQLEPIQENPVKEEIKQSNPVDVSVVKKDEFCKKPEKATIKFLESKFKDAQIEITDKQIILTSETSELKLNCFVEIPYIDEYYNHYRRKKLIKRLRDGQTSKAHSVCEYVGSIFLAA